MWNALLGCFTLSWIYTVLLDLYHGVTVLAVEKYNCTEQYSTWVFPGRNAQMLWACEASIFRLRGWWTVKSSLGYIHVWYGKINPRPPVNVGSKRLTMLTHVIRRIGHETVHVPATSWWGRSCDPGLARKWNVWPLYWGLSDCPVGRQIGVRPPAVERYSTLLIL